MRAVICVKAGGPDVLEVRDVPVPAVRDGWSLVQVKGAGLNRSELRRRQRHSPNVAAQRAADARHRHAARVFALDDIVAAHQYMEDDQATGKVVVLP